MKMSMLSKLLRFFFFLKTLYFWDWSDSSWIKSTDCSSEGPGFNSQYIHGGSQLSLTPASRGSHPLFWPPLHSMNMGHRYSQAKLPNTLNQSINQSKRIHASVLAILQIMVCNDSKIPVFENTNIYGTIIAYRSAEVWPFSN